MNKTSGLLSPAVISIVIMFLVGGIQAISSSINPAFLTVIMAVLGLAASYFHVSLGKQLGAYN